MKARRICDGVQWMGYVDWNRRLFDALVARQPASIGGLVARAVPEGWTFSKAPKRAAPRG